MEKPVLAHLSFCKIETSSILHTHEAETATPYKSATYIFRSDFEARLAMSCALLVFVCCLFVTGCIRLPRARYETAHSDHATPLPQTTFENPSRVSLLNINSATKEELATLPGIGDGFAARIVAHRTRHGDFLRKEHLLLVDGMGERRYKRLAAFITIQR